jgi:hypothetical protein
MQNINIAGELGMGYGTGEVMRRTLRTPEDVALERTKGILHKMDIKKSHKEDIFQMIKKQKRVSILNIELLISAAFCIINKFPLKTKEDFANAYKKSHVPDGVFQQDFLRYLRILKSI